MAKSKEVGTGMTADSEVKKKAVKLVVAHLKKKVTKEYSGLEYLIDWFAEMDELLEKEEFDIKEYYALRKELNSVVESTLDLEMREKIRNSWHSMGKSLAKKASPY